MNKEFDMRFPNSIGLGRYGIHIKNIRVLVFSLGAMASFNCVSDEYRWVSGYILTGKFQYTPAVNGTLSGLLSSPSEACEFFWLNSISQPGPGTFIYRNGTAGLRRVSDTIYGCGGAVWIGPTYIVNGKEYKFEDITWPFGLYAVSRVVVSCDAGKVANIIAGTCEASNELSKVEGEPDDKISCGAPSNSHGNPVNAASGNKFQVEYDLVGNDKLKFSRYYNSASGVWTHSYGAYLSVQDDAVSISFADGRISSFSLANGSITAEPSELGELVKSGDSWIYFSPNNENFKFNSLGYLVRIEGSGFPDIDIIYEYENTDLRITNSLGASMTLRQNKTRDVTLVESGDTSIIYNYKTSEVDGQTTILNSMTKTIGGSTQTRLYHYEDSIHPRALTGITDESGVRIATWKYDANGKAISSEHAGGVEKTSFEYDGDNSTTVTNSLGKRTKYNYQVMQGAKRITSVVGEVSANCSASNSSYTYNSRGQVDKKTDAMGYVTVHTYNDRGLEVSRTEASGTPAARAIITEWHPVFFLPTKLTEFARTTSYTYDSRGRETSRTISER